jgi:hypothetical protein
MMPTGLWRTSGPLSSPPLTSWIITPSKLSIQAVIWQQCGAVLKFYFHCLVFKLKHTFLSNMKPPSVPNWGARSGLLPFLPLGNIANFAKSWQAFGHVLYKKGGKGKKILCYKLSNKTNLPPFLHSPPLLPCSFFLVSALHQSLR